MTKLVVNEKKTEGNVDMLKSKLGVGDVEVGYVGNGVGGGGGRSNTKQGARPFNLAIVKYDSMLGNRTSRRSCDSEL